MTLKLAFTPLNTFDGTGYTSFHQTTTDKEVLMKVLAIGSIVKPLTDEQRKEIMPKEVPNTLKLYLDGKIDQFWYRGDKPGVIFLMNVETVEQATAATHALPLAAGGFMNFEMIPVGPLAPLGMLIQPK
jgi:hypothetical protein